MSDNMQGKRKPTGADEKYSINFMSVNAQTLSHKVIKIIDGDTVYVDFNDNEIPDIEL